MSVIKERDYSYEIDNLNNLITVIQENINFNLGLTWTILGVLVGFLTLASFFSIKSWFNKRFNEETKKIDERVHKFMKDNPQLLWAKGNANELLWELKQDGIYYAKYIITGLMNFKKQNIIYIDAYYFLNGQKVSISDVHMNASDDGIELTILSKQIPLNINVSFFILWSNPIYQDMDK